jgi:Fe2+ or Zn2+ uptake regulation protein
VQPIKKIVESFRQKGLKITPQRRLVFQALTGDDNHPTADDIYQRVVSTLPDVSRTTVYSTLGELVAQGELVTIHLDEGKTRYDTNTASHHHLICLSCHTLIDIHQDFDGLDLWSQEARGYHVVRQQVTFYGYCPDCQTS